MTTASRSPVGVRSGDADRIRSRTPTNEQTDVQRQYLRPAISYLNVTRGTKNGAIRSDFGSTLVGYADAARTDPDRDASRQRARQQLDSEPTEEG